MKKHLLAGLASGLALFNGPALAADAAPKICVNRYVTAVVIDDILRGVAAGLKAHGIPTEEMTIQNPEADAGTQQTLAQSFVSSGCEIILAITTPGAQVFKRVTDTIPVVFLGSATPLEAGLISSIAYPGGNFTGVANPAPVEADIDLMIEVQPKIKRVGIIYKSGDPAGDHLAKRAAAHLKARGLVPLEAPIANAGEAMQAAQTLVASGVEAIQIPGDSTTTSAMPAIVRAATEAGIPVFGGLREGMEYGALLSAAYDFETLGRVGADLIKRVLDGEDPGTIPVHVPDTSGLELHVTKARELGITFPPGLLARASATY
ncbi:putative ABC transport system substrate-binding protein [Pseudaminobacter salicylatoxidans]|uniref:Putative ABC transport system substrate-binding protein n=1 Tax=Pseudaminobacter salicylatoxidans TaxID=93369 RepID=A0A316C489_PSESE|nr:ABC transporter substrate-binding protein [Pseudaminobacter salicylatoxidans]PWJ84582.1 putative ABC transport system substrate-binding protein [Pseudaminobacter salicylatoxidans]